MTKSVTLHVRITQETKDELDRLAREDSRKTAGYVRLVLERHLQLMECLRELASGPVTCVEPPKYQSGDIVRVRLGGQEFEKVIE